jgi:hypothetical protein
MRFAGIIWASIICIPFWLAVILLVAGVIAIESIIFVGLVFSVLMLFFIFPSRRETNQDEQDNQWLIPATKIRPLYNTKLELIIHDNGGNRIGIDRRQFEYNAFIPERRSGIDRRKGFDRRNSIVLRKESERRNIFIPQFLN